jgi:hypothetical protein
MFETDRFAEIYGRLLARRDRAAHRRLLHRPLRHSGQLGGLKLSRRFVHFTEYVSAALWSRFAALIK